MKLLLNLDEHNYEPDLPEIRRTAVRGIILRDGQLLMIRSSFGEVKFPGGGQEDGETDEETLLREVLEETGYTALKESIRPYGEVIEKRRSKYEDTIWHQKNRYYFCTISGTQAPCSYTENEQRHGMHQLWITPAEAVALNRQMVQREGQNPWNRRELAVLELLLAHFEENGYN